MKHAIGWPVVGEAKKDTSGKEKKFIQKESMFSLSYPRMIIPDNQMRFTARHVQTIMKEHTITWKTFLECARMSNRKARRMVSYIKIWKAEYIFQEKAVLDGFYDPFSFRV